MAHVNYTSQEMEILDNMDNLEELNDFDSNYESVFETETDEEDMIISLTDSVTVWYNIKV